METSCSELEVPASRMRAGRLFFRSNLFPLAPPPLGGFGLAAFFAPESCSSDFAGHVGNIEGSIGWGFSLNHGCSSAFEHVVRCLGHR